MRILYTTDLHGAQWKYDRLLSAAGTHRADIVINGGDLLPKQGSPFHQDRFIIDYLDHHFALFHQAGIPYLCCLGNDDLRIFDGHFDEICQKYPSVLNLAQKRVSIDGFEFIGMNWVVNDRGETLQLCITLGNVDDRKPVPRLAKQLFGKLFGDMGYISQPLAQSLRSKFNIQLITKLRKHMKNRLMYLSDRIMLRRRAIVETVIDQLKNISQIEHSRHRRVSNFFVNVLCGLIAYCRRPSKPSLGFDLPVGLVA